VSFAATYSDRFVVETPDAAARYWTALGVVAPAPLPTPLPLAADLNGDVADVPAIAMSWLEGRPAWDGCLGNDGSIRSSTR
jgi:aminoglycoside phosphotransferase (APT) family kinase protein